MHKKIPGFSRGFLFFYCAASSCVTLSIVKRTSEVIRLAIIWYTFIVSSGSASPLSLI